LIIAVYVDVWWLVQVVAHEVDAIRAAPKKVGTAELAHATAVPMTGG